MGNIQSFDPHRQLGARDYELHHKRDLHLKDAELHHHDFYEIYFLLTGDTTCLIDGRLYRIMPGDLLLIAPRQLHQVCAQPETQAFERYVLWVEPQLLRRLSSDNSDLLRGLTGRGNQFRLSAQDRLRMQTLLEGLAAEGDRQDYGSDLLRESLLTQLLVTVNRLVLHQDAWVEEPKSGRTVGEIMAYINRHYSERITLDLLAEQFFVSKYHLSREFNRQVGTGIYRYIQKKRLLIARQLLDQGEKPNDVYSRCGFSDYTCFYRAFRAEYGIAPRKYARQGRTE